MTQPTTADEVQRIANLIRLIDFGRNYSFSEDGFRIKVENGRAEIGRAAPPYNLLVIVRPEAHDSENRL